VVVVIDLKTGDDAYVIFETLNARGTPLLASDLVKNFILQNASSKGYDPDDLYEQHWAAFEEAWWRDDFTQGRITRPRIDAFLNYWLTARRFEEVTAQNVFPYFRNYVTATVENPDSQVNLMDVVRDIRHNGATFRKLEESAGRTPEEATFIYRWKTMQAGVITPLLLELFSADTKLLTEERRLRALRALESFLVRRTICRMTTKDYNRLFLELLVALEGKTATADDVIVDFLAGQTADSREWPSDAQLTEAMVDLPLYRLLTRARLRMILEGLENVMRSAKAEEGQVPKGVLTIEHILPQKWGDYWPLEVVDDPEEYHRQFGTRERMKHTIGNLTLVTGKLNPALSNGEWDYKKTGLQEHSTLFMNKRLLADYGNRPFGEAEIQERSMELARLAAMVWPSPREFISQVK
jgi:hypothetical protein